MQPNLPQQIFVGLMNGSQLRAQLRALLIIWMAASLTWVAGYCAAIAISVFGFYEGVKSSASEATTLVNLGLMAVGSGLGLLLSFLYVRIRDRFEDLCWELIKADGGTSVDGTADTCVLRRQVDGSDARLAAVRARRSQQFTKRLQVLIERAWPRSPP